MCLQFTEKKKKKYKKVGSKGLESYYIMYSSRIFALKSHLISNNNRTKEQQPTIQVKKSEKNINNPME